MGKNAISTNIQYYPLQVLPEVQAQKVFEGEVFFGEIFRSRFFSPEIQVSFYSGGDEKGMGGGWGGEERQKRQRNEKVHVLFLILSETGFLTPCVLSKIFLTSFTFGSEGGPRPPFNQAVEKTTLTEKKELMNTKGDLHPYKANIPLFSLAEVIEVAIRAEYQVARTHISGPIKA